MNKKDMFDQIIRIAVNSSLCEIRASPKPGNIHRNRESPTTSYENFLTVAYHMKDHWSSLAQAVYKFIVEMRIDLRDIYVDYKYLTVTTENPHHRDGFGQSSLSKTEITSYPLEYVMFVFYSSMNMMKIQPGGNVLLGHFLLMGPLFCAAAAVQTYGTKTKKYFWKVCNDTIVNSRPAHSITLYQTLKFVNPGGMGTIEKYDIHSKSAFNELIADNMNLYNVFNLSKEYDSISSELVTNYEFTRTEILPKIEKLIDEYEGNLDIFFKRIPTNLIQSDLLDLSHDANEFVIRLFLYILGSKPDSLIMRKNPEHPEIAIEVSKKAMKLFDAYYTDDHARWYFDLNEFDEQLHRENGKRNPGTSADLLAASLFVKFIYQYFEF